MSNLIYSINATLPIFLLIILGKVLKTTKIINDEFTKTADRYVFRIALPALLFSDLTENNVVLPLTENMCYSVFLSLFFPSPFCGDLPRNS